ncbi:hypothetical protein ACS0TY_018102 [Phlomoides rotata]
MHRTCNLCLDVGALNTKHLTMDDMRNVHKQLLVAADSSTLTEALESLIETTKTSDGRLDLASKHILVLVLNLCQSPLKLSSQDLLLSIKLLRNLCAGEIKNQNLFIEQNGVGIISSLITSLGLSSGSDNRILHMVLQLLGNVSLAGEEHCAVVWRQFYPLGFLDVARVQSKETCGTLCMIIYTCSEGSNERSLELFIAPGLDIVVEIIRTLVVVGFREDWVKLLLSKVCFDKSYVSPIFSKLSLAVEAENPNDGESRTNFGAEQAFLLSTLSEIINDQVGDNVVSRDFSLCIFTILTTVVDFRSTGKWSLPTGSSDIDVMGYTLCILRDITARDSSKVTNRDEEEDVVDMLVSFGLIKFLIMLLHNLEPPAIIRKTMVQTKDGTSSQSSKYKCPYRGFRREVVGIIGNCSYRKKHVQDEIREQDGILLLLQQTTIICF